MSDGKLSFSVHLVLLARSLAGGLARVRVYRTRDLQALARSWKPIRTGVRRRGPRKCQGCATTPPEMGETPASGRRLAAAECRAPATPQL